MKNKEIEELLNELKEYASGGMSGLYPSEDTVKNLLSYIEQLKKENEFLKLDNPNANIKHFEMLKENKRKIDNLRYQKKQLESNRDKAIEILERHTRYSTEELLNILKR